MSSYSPAAIQVVVDKRSSGPMWEMSGMKASLWTMIVEGWLARAAAARPEGVALQAPHDSLSYAELLASACRGAAELVARGAGPGQRVAIALPPGLAFAQALHARLPLSERAGCGEVTPGESLQPTE